MSNSILNTIFFSQMVRKKHNLETNTVKSELDPPVQGISDMVLIKESIFKQGTLAVPNFWAVQILVKLHSVLHLKYLKGTLFHTVSNHNVSRNYS